MFILTYLSEALERLSGCLKEHHVALASSNVQVAQLPQRDRVSP